MSCEIHDDTWHCFLQEGEWVHIKKEEWNKSEMEPGEIVFPEIKGDIIAKYNITGDINNPEFNPFGKIWDILNGEENTKE